MVRCERNLLKSWNFPWDLEVRNFFWVWKLDLNLEFLQKSQVSGDRSVTYLRVCGHWRFSSPYHIPRSSIYIHVSSMLLLPSLTILDHPWPPSTVPPNSIRKSSPVRGLLHHVRQVQAIEHPHVGRLIHQHQMFLDELPMSLAALGEGWEGMKHKLFVRSSTWMSSSGEAYSIIW